MAEANWSFMTGSLADSQVRRGASYGYDPPLAGPASVYAMNCIVNTTGAVALYYNGAGYAPTPNGKGLKMTGAIKRGIGGGTTGFSAYLFSLAQGTNVSEEAYMLGLGETGHIVLCKGTLSNGVPDVEPGNSGVLARSTITIPVGTYAHLWLEAIVNPGNDTLVKAKINYSNVDPPSSQNWDTIPGIDDFIDDINGINSGSPGFSSGYGGYGGFFDEANRQTYYAVIAATVQP